MKYSNVVVAMFLLSAVALSSCAPNEILENDGQYHPELWEKEGNGDDNSESVPVVPQVQQVLSPLFRSESGVPHIPVVSHQNVHQSVKPDSVVQGQYLYSDPEGRSFTVKYIAGPTLLMANY